MQMTEAGKVLSKINRNQLITAWRAFKAVFINAGIDPDVDETEGSNNNEIEVSDTKEALYNTMLLEPSILSDVTPLVEVCDLIEADTTTNSRTQRIKIIAPGKGSSGYYPKEVLKRDGPRVFTKGTQMFINHDGKLDLANRPEGDYTRLAAVLTTDAYFVEDDPNGEGLYAEMKVFSDHAQAIREKAPYTGLSINALGKIVYKDVPGLGKQPVVEAITAAKSIDFVTKAGAGGKVVVLEESASTIQEQANMSNELLERIKGQEEQIATLRQELARAKATTMAFNLIEASTLPAVAKVKLKNTVTQGTVPLTEAGFFDEVAFKETVVGAIKAETEYLTQLGTVGVRNMGSFSTVSSTPNTVELEESIRTMIKNL
jgi:hypothetical protein